MTEKSANQQVGKIQAAVQEAVANHKAIASQAEAGQIAPEEQERLQRANARGFLAAIREAQQDDSI